jgi:hypothetical protein
MVTDHGRAEPRAHQATAVGLIPLVGNDDPVGFVKRLGDDVVPLLAQVG